MNADAPIILDVGEYLVILKEPPRPGVRVPVVAVHRLTGEVEEGTFEMVPDPDGSYRTAEAVLEALRLNPPRD